MTDKRVQRPGCKQGCCRVLHRHTNGQLSGRSPACWRLTSKQAGTHVMRDVKRVWSLCCSMKARSWGGLCCSAESRTSIARSCTWGDPFWMTSVITCNTGNHGGLA